jgi:hypothetical protein
MVIVDGNKISLRSQLSINKPIFYQAEYANLKDFFDKIVAKHAQQIVLKKS